MLWEFRVLSTYKICFQSTFLFPFFFTLYRMLLVLQDMISAPFYLLYQIMLFHRYIFLLKSRSRVYYHNCLKEITMILLVFSLHNFRTILNCWLAYTLQILVESVSWQDHVSHFFVNVSNDRLFFGVFFPSDFTSQDTCKDVPILILSRYTCPQFLKAHGTIQCQNDPNIQQYCCASCKGKCFSHENWRQVFKSDRFFLILSYRSKGSKIHISTKSISTWS